MIKQVVAIVVLSLAVLLGVTYVQQGLQYIVAGHDWVAQVLVDVFSGGDIGNLIRQMLALLAIPVGTGVVLALVYWLIKRSFFPYFMHVVWVLWLVQTAALTIQATV